MQDICYNFNNFDELTDKDLRDRIRNLNVHIEALPAIIGRTTTPRAHAYYSRRLERCKADVSAAQKEIQERWQRSKTLQSVSQPKP